MSSNSLCGGSILPSNYSSITCLRLGCEAGCVSVALKRKVVLMLRRLDPTPKFTAMGTLKKKNSNSPPHAFKHRYQQSRIRIPRAPRFARTGEPVRSKSAEHIFHFRLPENVTPTENSVQTRVLTNTGNLKKEKKEKEEKKKEAVSRKRNQSKRPLSDSSPSKTAGETTLPGAPVLLSCPPPSAVTSARQSLETEKHTRPSSEPGAYPIL